MNISKAQTKEGSVTNIQRLKLNKWEYRFLWWDVVNLADCLVELLQGGTDHSFNWEVTREIQLLERMKKM